MIVVELYNSYNNTKKAYKDIDNKMQLYLNKYGEHFNKNLCEFAVSNMTKNNEPLVFLDIDVIDKLLLVYKITIDNDILYDKVFVYHMAIADYWKSSISDELHLSLYIKDVLDDTDGYKGIAFNRWYTDMCKKNIIIDWESMI